MDDLMIGFSSGLTNSAGHPSPEQVFSSLFQRPPTTRIFPCQPSVFCSATRTIYLGPSFLSKEKQLATRSDSASFFSCHAKPGFILTPQFPFLCGGFFLRSLRENNAAETPLDE